MEKLDLTKLYKSYYTAKTKPELIMIEPAQYLSITGKGDPSGEEFARNIETLYPVAYAIKFMCKGEDKDFTVAKLEAQWWFDEQKYSGMSVAETPTKVPRSEWEYRLLIRLPEYVTDAQVTKAISDVVTKKKLPQANNVQHYKMTEGKCVQMMHIGPFDKEPETLALMMEMIAQNNFAKNGLHHEIYLSDFRKTEPDKLKTILREPVK